MEVQEWLGADNQLGLDIWQNKYRDDSETFDAWLDRVSGGDEQVRELIKEQNSSLEDASWLTEALKQGKEDYPFQLLCGRTAGRQH